jgi:hypothetical protein
MMPVAPDYAEPVRGWRSWIADPGGDAPVLRSVVHAAGWAPGRALVAACMDRRYAIPGVRPPVFAHDAPHPSCRCGIHAARRVEDALHHVRVPSRLHATAAVGTVALWGSVVEGPDGWRASRAYPSEIHLLLRRPGGAAIRALEDVAAGLGAYGVPVAIAEDDGRGSGTVPALSPA